MALEKRLPFARISTMIFAGGIRGEVCAVAHTRALVPAGGETAHVGVLLTSPPRGKVDLYGYTCTRLDAQRESSGCDQSSLVDRGVTSVDRQITVSTHLPTQPRVVRDDVPPNRTKNTRFPIDVQGKSPRDAAEKNSLDCSGSRGTATWRDRRRADFKYKR